MSLLFPESKEDAKWYVIRVVSGTEEKVRISLLQRRETFGLENYIMDCFVPTHDVITSRADGVRSKRKKNIYPGYILVQMIVTNESWYIVRNTPNVTGFLGSGSIPVPVTKEELEKIQGLLEEKKEEYKTALMIGDYATITTGTFEGSEGRIAEINEKKGCLKITINLLGRDTPIEVSFNQVKIKNRV